MPVPLKPVAASALWSCCHFSCGGLTMAAGPPGMGIDINQQKLWWQKLSSTSRAVAVLKYFPSRTVLVMYCDFVTPADIPLPTELCNVDKASAAQHWPPCWLLPSYCHFQWEILCCLVKVLKNPMCIEVGFVIWLCTCNYFWSESIRMYFFIIILMKKKNIFVT